MMEGREKRERERDGASMGVGHGALSIADMAL